jgi:hypothetical protein
LHRETKLAQTFVSEPDILAAPERWPEFAERASQLGFRAVHGFPLRVREEALGALNVFLSETGPFSADDIAAVQALADVAAIGIAQERSVATGSGYEAPLVGTMAVPATNRSLSGCTLEAGATVVAADVTKDERFDGATRPTPSWRRPSSPSSPPRPRGRAPASGCRRSTGRSRASTGTSTCAASSGAGRRSTCSSRRPTSTEPPMPPPHPPVQPAGSHSRTCEDGALAKGATMSSYDRPESQPTRRITGGGSPEDQTRRLDDGDLGADRTRRLDQGDQDHDRTRRLDQGDTAHGAYPHEEVGADEHHLAEGAPLEEEAVYEEAEEPSRRGRDAIIGLAGLLLGVVLAFVLVALGTRTPGTDPETADAAALQERIAELEAQVDEQAAQVAGLEAQLADEDVATDQRAADLEAQRQAQEQRSAALDARAQALDEREAALDRRAAEPPPVAPPPPDAPVTDPAPDEPPADEQPGGGLPSLPDIDTEQAETIIERVLEQIRDLFQR